MDGNTNTLDGYPFNPLLMIKFKPLLIVILLGLIGGIGGGYISSNTDSVKVSLSRSAASSDTVFITGVVHMPDGKRIDILPRLIDGDSTDTASLLSNPLSLLDAKDRTEVIESQPFLVIRKDTSTARSRVSSEVSRLGGKILSDNKYGNLRITEVENISETQARRLEDDGNVESVVRGNLYFRNDTGTTFGYNSNDSRGQTFAALDPSRPTGEGVTVGIVDTGISNSSLPVVGGENYSVGPEDTRISSMMQPWMNERSFPVTIPQGGGWVNVVVSWPVFGEYSPSDLDLVLKNENGVIIAESKTSGNVTQSEKIEFFAPANNAGLVYTAEYSVVGEQERTHVVADTAVGRWIEPSFSAYVEAAQDPSVIEVVLTDETTTRPIGAHDSITGVWKLGNFNVHGNTYNLALSDVEPETVCRETIREEIGLYHSMTALIGYDAFAVDLDGDGTYESAGRGRCIDNAYFSADLIIDDVQYAFNLGYSTRYYTQWPTYSFTFNKLSLLNDRSVSFLRQALINPDNGSEEVYSDVYGPSPNTKKDFIGHGTHVGGIVNGIAPDAKLYSSKVFGGSGFASRLCSTNLTKEYVYCSASNGATDIDIINGIEGAVQAGARVINLSLGFDYEAPNQCEDFALVQYLKDLIQNRGVTVVAAAGNSGDSISGPGCLEDVITVGAVGTSATAMVTEYSGRGPTNEGLAKPDIVAVGGDTPTLPTIAPPDHIGYIFPGGVASRESESMWSYFGVTDRAGAGYIKMSGTSMAAPYVAGAVAILLERYPDLTPAEVKRALMETADDIGYPATEQGAGLINIDAALQYLEASPTPIPVLLGDINTDGKINIVDALLIGQHVNGLITLSADQLSRADTNDDGDITLHDANVVARYDGGQITSLPFVFIPGDIDRNGLVNEADLSILYQVVDGTRELETLKQKLAADFNGDGRISQEDADELAEFVIGPTPTPTPTPPITPTPTPLPTVSCGSDGICNRAEIAQALVDAIDFPFYGGDRIFSDVPRSHPNYDAIQAIASEGITSGCGGGNYCPDATLSRGHWAVFLSRARGFEIDACTEDAFSDVTQSHSLCKYVMPLKERGITSGCGGGNYCVNAGLTQIQAEIMLQRGEGR